MEFTEILKKSIKLYRRNLIVILPHFMEYLLDLIFLIIFGIFAFIAIGSSISPIRVSPFGGLGIYGEEFMVPSFSAIAFLIFGFFIFLLIATFLSSMARGAIIGMAREGIEVEKSDLSTGWKSAKKYGIRIFSYQILISLVLVISSIIAIVPLVLAFSRPDSTSLIIFAIFFALAMLVFYVIVYIALLFIPQFVVLKNTGVVEGAKESYRFVRSNISGVIIYILAVVGVMIVVGIINSVISFPINLFAKESFMLRIFLQIFQNLFSFVIGLIVAPYFEIVKTYMVKEGNRNEIAEQRYL